MNSKPDIQSTVWYDIILLFQCLFFLFNKAYLERTMVIGDPSALQFTSAFFAVVLVMW
jgi:hypothetical protein